MAAQSQHELMPAITLLERKVEEAERKVNDLLGALNVLRAEAGLPPRSANGGGGSVGVSQGQTQIRPDSFFGKKQQTAIRQYLEMRRAQGLGPAKPREIYDALLAGGFEYEAKSEEVALVGMRALLRKRSEAFVQLSNGSYGLVSWYPELKRPRPSMADDVDSDQATESADESVSPSAVGPDNAKVA